MKTIAMIMKLGPWSRPGWQPEPLRLLPDWADRATHDLLNRSSRCGGVWVGHGSIEEDAIRGVHEIARQIKGGESK